jgi:hypothetical protein
MGPAAMPKSNVIAAGVGAGCVVAGFLWVITMSNGEKPKTMNPKWAAATKEYMKFQGTNPIFGFSKK